MDSELNTLLPPRFLFRFGVAVKQARPIWGPKGVALDPSYALPDLASLDAATPSSEPRFADVRMAWAPEGLAFTVSVREKRQPLWCRDGRQEDSDGLQVWIDTRATHNIHRASKFCCRLVFMPAGGRGEEPMADQLLIPRARENARPMRPRELQVVSKVLKDGYDLAAFVPGSALTGFDPANHPRLGFNYAVIDRERGTQTFASGPGLPYDEDPSCWATLAMVAE